MRRDKRIWVLCLGVFVAVFLFSFLVAKFKDNGDVDAANLAAFDAGYIISDYQMGNYNSMSEADIQKFLTSKNPCGNTNYSYYLQLSANKNYTWHWDDGHFVCLSEEKFGDGEVIGSGETAAHIIWRAAQDYRINPQVLIVLLQKETGLITDPIPNNGDYRKATGYGCPDTAACSSKYYGFKNQIRNAAALFRTVLDGGWTNYPLGNNYVQYNPNAACGGSVVNIRSLATSALYRYTPYQPNASSLAAGYGTGDSCASYGNRNFYNYFEDWFGGVKEEKSKEPVVEAKTEYKTPIPDGTYQIISKAFPEKAMDIKGGIKNGMVSAPLQMYARKTTDARNQVFEIKYDSSNGYYSITNPSTNLAVDVKGAKTDNSTPTQVYPSHDRCNQDWLFEEDNEGYYTIISRCSGKVLDASLSTSAVNIFARHNGNNQKWKLVKVNMDGDNIATISGTYQIISKASPDKSIDIKGGVYEGMTSSAPLQIYPTKTSNRENQLFKIEYDKSNGFYSITNPATGMSVDVKGAGIEDKTHTQVYPSHDRCNQDWLFEQDSEGYYMIISRCSGKVLDAALSSSFVNIFTSHGGDNQKWRLVKE